VKPLLVAASLLVVAPGLAAADRLKVAIVPGIAVNLDTARVDALSQDLANALTAELDIDALGGLEVRRMLPIDGLPPDCVATPTCTAEVARRLGATQLLFVVMVSSGVGGAVQVDSTWLEPSTGKNTSRPTIDLASSADTDATAKFASFARQLLPDAPVRPKPKTGISGNLSGGRPRHFTTTTMITGGAAVVGLGFGIALGLSTRSKYNACEREAMTGICTPSERDSIRNRGLAADAGFLVATGAAIATLVLYATSAESPHVVVTPSPEGGMVSAIGRF
jgi:hypothetical protein